MTPLLTPRTAFARPPGAVPSSPRSRIAPVLIFFIGLALCFFASRLAGLTALPLHNDEGLHLTRAVEVWNGNPFWEIRDGKIVNHWLIALFDPRHAPAFIGRIASVFVSLFGLAAGVGLARRAFGLPAGVMAGLMLVFSPYLLFYERLAFSDAAAGAWIVAALAVALRWRQTGHLRHAALTGVFLAIAALFKFTALPFAVTIAAVIVLERGSIRLRRALTALALVAGIGTAAFVVPIAVLIVRGNGLFDIATGWLGGGSAGGAFGFIPNIERLIALLATFGSANWGIALIVGLLALVIFASSARVRLGLRLALYVLVPFTLMLIIGREVLPRHYVVVLPALATLAGMGNGTLFGNIQTWKVVRTLDTKRFRLIRTRLIIGMETTLYPVLIILILLFGFLPFAVDLARGPEQAALPDAVFAEHISDHSAGYALRDAVRDLPLYVRTGQPVIASMFPDSCRRANFEAVPGYRLTCTDAPGIPLLEAALAAQGVAYVLTDTAPLIGLDGRDYAAAHGLSADRLAAYTRPGHTAPAVVLWRLTR